MRNRYITARIPLQSPIGSEEPIGDSFSPGEAIEVLPHQQLPVTARVVIAPGRRGQCRTPYGVRSPRTKVRG